ncbi:MAB_1171c family putative transporter [Streptomyces sp. H39-S7]|uniref:MAB_1171c family putative transporter n=1 Tax=Streptomyces sp. H39-S7 TaxID=3004357 RepID=UPI0022AF6229|nr:MAB_1171c family putative transporter [Streptomyces sp. H39-S7]MCZ4123661.1 hypothetical protein [Streptomyces sp. H39-S7]
MSALHPYCLAISSLGFVLLLWGLKSSKKKTNAALLLLALTYLASAGSFVIEMPPIWSRIDNTFGVTNIAVPLSQSWVMLVCTCQSSVIAYWAYAPSQARRAAKWFFAAGAVVIAGLLVTFFKIPPDDFATFQVREWSYATYLSIYIAAYTAAQGYLTVQCWKLAHRVGVAWVAWSLRIISVGALITIGQSIIRTANLLGMADVKWLDLAWLCGDLGTLLTSVGYLLPTLVDRARETYTWANEHYTYKRLGPLWEALHTASPEITAVKAPPQRTTFLRLRSINFALYRRSTEIRDGMIELRPYLDAGARGSAETRHAQLAAPEHAAAVTAEQIHQALRAHQEGRQATTSVEWADARVPADTAAREMQLLLRIAAHFKRQATAAAAAPGSPLVPTAS